LVHDPETDTWHNVRRETSTTEPPPLPPRDQVELTPEEAAEALQLMQRQVWGDQHAAWVLAQQLAADTAARELPAQPCDVGRLANWALDNGRRLTAALMPPKPYGFASQYAADLFDLLVYYFAGDEAGFLAQARRVEATALREFNEPIALRGLSIHKGLALLGPVGVGKTLLLRTFAANPIRPFRLLTAEQVEAAYRAGEAGLKAQQALCGRDGRHLCIDDVCTEEKTVKDFGNPDAPMAKLILGRYKRYQDGILPRWATHLSSNNPLYRTKDLPANMPSWEERYGERAVNRLEELCNIIPFIGESRRA